MLKYLAVAFLFIFPVLVQAQTDSLFVYPRNNEFAIMYKVQHGETIFTLSRRFHVPPAILADANGLTYQSGIANNTLLMIPLAVYNYLKEKPASMNDVRPLYYRARGEDNLYKISKYANVSQRQLQEWNKLTDNSVRGDQALLVGWVLFDATGVVTTPKNNVTTPAVSTTTKTLTPQVQKTTNSQQMIRQVVKNKDGSTTIFLVPADTPKHVDSIYITSPFGKLYLQQTDSGSRVDSEKGPAVFFDTKMAMSKNMFYAFHNTIPRGSVIKVYVPNTQKTILVKVIGTIPETKQYFNCIIAISNTAKEALDIHEDKAWCELWFAQSPAKKLSH